MNGMDHERARKLLTADAVEGVTSSERRWLETHVATCHECSTEAAALRTPSSLCAPSLSSPLQRLSGEQNLQSALDLKNCKPRALRRRRSLDCDCDIDSVDDRDNAICLAGLRLVWQLDSGSQCCLGNRLFDVVVPAGHDFGRSGSIALWE